VRAVEAVTAQHRARVPGAIEPNAAAWILPRQAIAAVFVPLRHHGVATQEPRYPTVDPAGKIPAFKRRVAR
jgi:hypothetical protein